MGPEPDETEAHAAEGQDDGTPEDGALGDERVSALPPKVETWRRRSATGAILTGFALGLQDVLEVERKEPAIVMETTGAPPRDLPVDADLEDARPRHNVVRVRPWLLDEARAEADTQADTEGATADRSPTPIPDRAPRRRLRRRR